MKPIDAEPIIKNLSEMKTKLGYDAITIDGMLKALREAEEVTAAQQPNDPLTEEQLREMEGEPVYLGGEGLDRWDIFSGISTDGFACFWRAALSMDGCGKTWVPYRRKPEAQPAKGEGTE